MPISTPDLNKLKAALKAKRAILARISNGEIKPTASSTPNLYGNGVKIVKERNRILAPLTKAQKAEIVYKYLDGMGTVEISRQYGCHHSTISRALKQQGVTLRPPVARRK